MSLTLSHVQTPALTEAPPIYYGILTDQGQALLANAIASGIPLQLTHMAIGDGAGQPVTPQPEMTELVNEVHRAPLNQLFVDPTASNEIVAEMVMDETTGGFWIRELGLYDESGILFAVANAPASYKPVLAEGAGRALLTRMVLIVSDASAVELILNPDTVMASLAYVDAKIAEHAASRDHPAAAEGAQGMIPLATPAMVAEGVDHGSAVTPAGAAATFAQLQHEHEIDDVLWLQEALDEKANLGHTHTPQEAGAAPAEHGHEIEDVSGLQGKLDGKYDKAGGAIEGDFWHAYASRRYGAVCWLGSQSSNMPALVLLAKKYIDAMQEKSGFVGRISFHRGSLSTTNITDLVDLAVTSAYSVNDCRLFRRSGIYVGNAKIVEVSHNGEVYYALYYPQTSGCEVVAYGHAFDATLPLLIPNATDYTMTDVLAKEEDYHVGNKPTAAEVGAFPVTGGKLEGPLKLAQNQYIDILTDPAVDECGARLAAEGRYLILRRNPSPLEVAEYPRASDHLAIHAALDVAGSAYFRRGKVDGSGGYEDFEIYHEGHKPTTADVGAFPSSPSQFGGDLNTLGDGVFMLTTTVTNKPAGAPGQGDHVISYEWNVDAGTQVYHRYSSATPRMFIRSKGGSEWSAWNEVYHQGFNPSPSDIGAAPTIHTHTAAQGNQDIVAGGYGQVGTYVLARLEDHDGKGLGDIVPGGSLVPVAMDVGNWDGARYKGYLAGSWKLLGDNESGRDMMSLYFRVA